MQRLPGLNSGSPTPATTGAHVSAVARGSTLTPLDGSDHGGARRGRAAGADSLRAHPGAGTARCSFTVSVSSATSRRGTSLPLLVEFNTLGWAITSNAMLTGTFEVSAEHDDRHHGDRRRDDPAPTTTSPLDSFTGTLNEAGTPIAVITEIQLNVENGLEARFVVGSRLAHPAVHRSNCSGTMTAYFENSLLLDKFINETESDISFELARRRRQQVRQQSLAHQAYNGGQPDVEVRPPSP